MSDNAKTIAELIEGLRAEIARLNALATCRCGDGFTGDDPGQCGNCSVSQRLEIDALKAENDGLRAEVKFFRAALSNISKIGAGGLITDLANAALDAPVLEGKP